MLSVLSGKILTSDNYFGRNNYYRAILNQYANICSYTNILNETANLNPIQSDISVQPRMLGASIKSIISKYGKPIFVFNENKITIYIYKWKFNDLKTRCEIHFYNDTAFLVNYNYNQLDTREKNYIVKTIAKKYTGKDTEIDIRNCKIVDDKNNMVCVSEFLEGLKITYLSDQELGWHVGLTTDINTKKEMHKAKVKMADRLFYNNI
jgi:hypothetical protein